MNRLLTRLQCPVANLVSRLDDLDAQVGILTWLEDRKIRELDIDERAGIKDYNSDTWSESVSTYFESFDCPYQWTLQAAGEAIPSSNKQCLQWLVQYAVQLDAEDQLEAERTKASRQEPIEPELLVAIGQLTGTDMKINESASDYLRRVQGQLRDAILRSSTTQVPSLSQLLAASRSEGYNNDSSNQPISEEDKVAAVGLVLRLLHVNDLKELQHDLGDLLQLAQSKTAKPRMNVSAGKVGR